MRKKLSPDEIDSALRLLDGWTFVESRQAIERQFKFKNFVEAFSFMTACALEAEKHDHHPDWSNSYATVDVSLTTHSAKGITQLDIHLAQKMEKLI